MLLRLNVPILWMLHLLGALGGDDHLHHPAGHLVQLHHHLLTSQGIAGVTRLRGSHWNNEKNHFLIFELLDFFKCTMGFLYLIVLFLPLLRTILPPTTVRTESVMMMSWELTEEWVSHLQDNITHYTDQSTGSTDNQLLESSQLYLQSALCSLETPHWQSLLILVVSYFIVTLTGFFKELNH